MNVTTTLTSPCIVAREFVSKKMVGRKSGIDVPLNSFPSFVENIAEKSIRSGK